MEECRTGMRSAPILLYSILLIEYTHIESDIFGSTWSIGTLAIEKSSWCCQNRNKVGRKDSDRGCKNEVSHDE
jgi:hypothetical protein